MIIFWNSRHYLTLQTADAWCCNQSCIVAATPRCSPGWRPARSSAEAAAWGWGCGPSTPGGRASSAQTPAWWGERWRWWDVWPGDDCRAAPRSGGLCWAQAPTGTRATGAATTSACPACTGGSTGSAGRRHMSLVWCTICIQIHPVKMRYWE